MTTFLDQMRSIAADVNALGEAFATVDLVEAVANLPCLYVAPPSIDYTRATLSNAPVVEHTVVALSSRSAEDVEALAELVGLIDAATRAIPTIERVEPAAYPLTAEHTAPAYLLTLTR